MVAKASSVRKVAEGPPIPRGAVSAMSYVIAAERS